MNTKKKKRQQQEFQKKMEHFFFCVHVVKETFSCPLITLQKTRTRGHIGNHKFQLKKKKNLLSQKPQSESKGGSDSGSGSENWF